MSKQYQKINYSTLKNRYNLKKNLDMTRPFEFYSVLFLRFFKFIKYYLKLNKMSTDFHRDYESTLMLD